MELFALSLSLTLSVSLSLSLSLARMILHIQWRVKLKIDHLLVASIDVVSITDDLADKTSFIRLGGGLLINIESCG